MKQAFIFALPFGVLVSVFLFISAGAHALISLPNATYRIYESDLEKGINRFRWFEYALSSSVMIVLISTLFGVLSRESPLGSWFLFICSALVTLIKSRGLFGRLLERILSLLIPSRSIWFCNIWKLANGRTIFTVKEFISFYLLSLKAFWHGSFCLVRCNPPSQQYFHHLNIKCYNGITNLFVVLFI